MTVFCVVCDYQLFGGTCCLHIHGNLMGYFVPNLASVSVFVRVWSVGRRRSSCCSVMLSVGSERESERERERESERVGEKGSYPTLCLYLDYLLLEHRLILPLRSSSCPSIALLF